MFQPFHWAIFRSTIVQSMLKSTTGRNSYYGMYSELQVKLTSLNIKLILKFVIKKYFNNEISFDEF